MSVEGYWQAIANYVYEVDKIASELDNIPGTTITKTISFLSKGEQFHHFEERLKMLDALVPIIAQTYHRSEVEVDRDIGEYMQKQISNFLKEEHKNENPNNNNN